MGLDLVECIMEVEERFQINLPDEELEQMDTVADLAALVMARLPVGLPQTKPCPSMVGFNRFRSLLIAEVGMPRGAIRPGVRLETLFPPGNRDTWQRLRRVSGVPALVVRADYAGLFVLIAIVPAILMLLHSGLGVVALTAGVLALVFWRSRARKIRDSFAMEFPPGAETVGDMARLCAPWEPSFDRSPRTAPQDVLNIVRGIVADTTGYSLDRVQADTRFCEIAD